jgi:hypothetical protein
MVAGLALALDVKRTYENLIHHNLQNNFYTLIIYLFRVALDKEL